MLIPSAKFLVLPLVAVAIIAALPSAVTGSSKNEIRASVIPAQATTDCGQRPCQTAKSDTNSRPRV